MAEPLVKRQKGSVAQDIKDFVDFNVLSSQNQLAFSGPHNPGSSAGQFDSPDPKPNIGGKSIGGKSSSVRRTAKTGKRQTVKMLFSPTVKKEEKRKPEYDMMSLLKTSPGDGGESRPTSPAPNRPNSMIVGAVGGSSSSQSSSASQSDIKPLLESIHPIKPRNSQVKHSSFFFLWGEEPPPPTLFKKSFLFFFSFLESKHISLSYRKKDSKRSKIFPWMLQTTHHYITNQLCNLSISLCEYQDLEQQLILLTPSSCTQLLPLPMYVSLSQN